MTCSILAAIAISIIPAQPPEAAVQETDTLAEATVSGYRTRVGGPVRTEIDSSALKRDISTSMAGLLAYSSSLFIKQSGKASLSTVSLRGTSSSHTQVLWNGMKINSPMLGMTDFSLIPAYFMDKATILHGSSSLHEVAGGLGGVISLESALPVKQGLHIEYVQGFGSFLTAHEYLEAEYRKGGFSTSTRLLLSTSRNDFKFVNMDKKEIAYDEQMNITGSWHPVERNRNGEYRDLHVMQEAGYGFHDGSNLVISAWYLDSWRQQPPLTVDYGSGSGSDYLNEQEEKTLRMTAGWDKAWGRMKAELSAGYAWTRSGYEYERDFGNGIFSYITNSLVRTHTGFAKGEISGRPGQKWLLEGSLTAYLHSVSSGDKSAVTTEGTGTGYDASRLEMSAYASVRWTPSEHVGMALSVREECYGGTISPPVPEFEADVLLARKWDLHLIVTASGNYRYPTLNDLYYIPGGNPELRPEKSLAYDAGYSLSRSFLDGIFSLSARGNWFDSYIRDWIMWIPDGAKKNFWTPLNVLRVHAYGIEQEAAAEWKPGQDWKISFNGHFTWSPSVNLSDPENEQDASYGKQLPYIPRYSGSFAAGLSFREWALTWKWCWYGRRYTTSDNSVSVTGSVIPYLMNDISLRKRFGLRHAVLDISLNINNLFNEQYVTVLSRPMPGINYEIFIGITPLFKCRHDRKSIRTK